jgi:uncharacterized protein (TIGR00297 family)
MSLLLQTALAAAITAAFALGAKALRGVTASGALAGSVVSFALCMSAGFGAFLILLSVFLLSYVATRIGRSRKEALGTAERREGRKATQVVANLGIGALAAVLSTLQPQQAMFLLAMTAAFAEAAADTVSSEVGQVITQEARLITNWRVVSAGTDGGVTLAGTVAGIVAAFIIGCVSATMSLIGWQCVPLAGLAGITGMFFDSLLGATFERKNLLDNDKVNFLGTLAAASVAILARHFLR